MKQVHHETERVSSTPSFLKSSSIDKDQFEGKTQEQITKHIVSLIGSNNAGNKLLGLDGAWGSGKSNLIEILRSKLPKKTYHCLFRQKLIGPQSGEKLIRFAQAIGIKYELPESDES